MDFKTINKKLDAILKQARKPAPLSFDEACAYLKISKSTLYKLTSSRAIPHYKPKGQMIYFSIEDLEKFVYSHKIETLENIKENFNNSLT